MYRTKTVGSALILTAPTLLLLLFLESRNHESPTQHVLNVFETMNKPLTFLRDIFIDLDRHDVVTVLNYELNWFQVGNCLGNETTPTPLHKEIELGSAVDVKDIGQY